VATKWLSYASVESVALVLDGEQSNEGVIGARRVLLAELCGHLVCNFSNMSFLLSAVADVDHAIQVV
jgi:hypothetical protein